MVSSKDQNSIYDIKLSTVSSGRISGNDAVQELTAMDLAMKLHYIRFVYYFKHPTFEGFNTILKLKETMFNWLNHAYIPCGRVRRSDTGRPFIKCNDSGVRLIEAKCRFSLDEWLESEDDSSHKLLVPDKVLGPDLGFSPLVFMQLTDFKCGGKAVGVSWSHVLGDAFSATTFINLWAQAITAHYPAQPLIMAQQQNHTCDIHNPNPDPDPLSVKRVGPVGDLWSTSNSSKMETYSFHMSKSELTRLQAQICGEKVDQLIPEFECICVAIWQSLAKGKDGSGPQVVTICQNDIKTRNKGIITNESQTINLIKATVPIENYKPLELAYLIMRKVDNERMKIEDAMRREDGLLDFLLYGANLTFVDLKDVPVYEMEVRGHKPVYVNCWIDNVGDNGVVLVLPAPEGDSDGRVVSVTLPENQVVKFKSVFRKDWCIE